MLRVVGERVRIGVQAPGDLAVARKEVYDELQQEGEGRADS